MTSVSYMLRAIHRVRTLGLADALEYSFHVVKKKALAIYIDLRYGGALTKNERDWRPNSKGRHINMPTDVYSLQAVFSACEIRSDDVLVDVGCGGGFAIAYWLSLGLKNQIIGIELYPEAARSAKARFARRPNVTIIEGDATVEAAKSGGTLFYLSNPFSEEPTRAFEQSMRGLPIRIAYWRYMYLDAFSPQHWNIKIIENLKPDYRQYRFALLTPILRS